MSKYKAVIDFSGYTAEDLLGPAMTIDDKMTGSLNFPAPPVSMATYSAHLDDYKDKLAKKASKATADLIAFTIARHHLEGDLGEIGGYVNTTAQGDAAMVVSSGFPYYETGHAPDLDPPPAPTNVRLRQGDLSGSLVGRARTARGRSLLEVETCTGDPNVEANWSPAGMFSGGKVMLSGIVPGTTMWVRMRSVGLKGVMGSWSDPAKIMIV